MAGLRRTLERRLEAEHPPEGKLVVASLTILRQLGAAHPERPVEPGDEPRVANAMFGAKPDAGIAEESESARRGNVIDEIVAVSEVGEGRQPDAREQPSLGPRHQRPLELGRERDQSTGRHARIDAAHAAATRKLVAEVLALEQRSA